MKLNRDLHHIMEDLLTLLIENGSISEDDAHRITGKGTKEPSPRVFSAEFEQLWEAYPSRVTDNGKRVKLGKALAYRQFLRYNLSAFSLGVLIDLAKEYGKQHPDGKYVKDMERWLKSEPWLDGAAAEVVEKKEPDYTRWEDEE